MSTEHEELRARAQAWLDDDPNPEDARELAALLDAERWDELQERMNGTLQFGTAGLRGIVGAGSNRMNRAVVIRASRGVADYLLSRVPDAKTLPVVVGADARHSSEQFAEDTRRVLAAARIPVRYFEEPVPTPIVAYAARQLSASAAICVTASHNPPEYNGYKVYASNAAQIIPPVDGEIADRISKVGSTKEVRLAELPSDLAEPVPQSLIDRYFDDVEALRPQGGEADRSLKIVYTPLHGVGGKHVLRALGRAGFSQLLPVEEQLQPDGSFPSVSFPNPEEDGALDLSLALAKEHEADLVLANDPDADRLAVAVPTPAGRWELLTGNQIGCLLADFMLSQAPTTPRRMVLSSIVSSPMLGAIASAYDAHFEQTLTGFKWIWNAALALEGKESVRYTFGYEEAIGFSAGHLVRDKDGISCAVLMAELAARLRAQGLSLVDRLDQLYRQHGLWHSLQRSVVRPGTKGRAEIDEAMTQVTASPPRQLAGLKVEGVTDYSQGAQERAPWLPAASLLELDLGQAGRVLVRPSGTEPKLKVYVDLRAEVPATDSVRGTARELAEQAGEVASELLRAAGLEVRAQLEAHKESDDDATDSEESADSKG